MAHSPLSRDELIKKCGLFLRVGEPWLSKFIGDEAVLTSSLNAWQQTHPEVRVFTLDGQRMRSADEFEDELTRGLSLPDYYGRNLNALSECLTDADILKGEVLVLFIRNADKILSEANPEALDGFLDVLRNAGVEWASPVNEGQAWDRGAVPFHVVIQMREAGRSALSLLPSL